MAHTTPLSVHKQLDNGLKLLTKIQVDEVQVGTTPKDLVFEIDKVRLFRYRPLADKASGAEPVLVAYGMVGRYTMADLQPDRSLIRNLLAQGLTVYVVDWGNPNRADRWLSFEDYVEDYLGGCVQHILREHSITSLNLLGICEGGVLTMCYAALHPAEVRNLILTITPVDFHADRAEGRLDRGFINLWTRSVDEGDIQRVIDSYGYIPGKFMGLVFSMITPAKTLTKYNLDLAEVFEDEDRLRNFLRMEQWLADRPHHPGEAGRDFFIRMYQRNELAEGRFTIGDQVVKLSALTMPVLNIFALEDHIIPPPCSQALGRLVGTRDYSELALPGGHVGVFVSGKSQGIVGAHVVKWLEARSGAGETRVTKTPARKPLKAVTAPKAARPVRRKAAARA
ncbi:MAG: alpha/beta fold hydrolase [Rubrivivax sp.]